MGTSLETPQGWRRCRLGDQVTLQRGVDITKEKCKAGNIPVISSGGVSAFHDTSIAPGPGVLLGRKGSVGSVHFSEGAYWPHDTTLWVKDFKGNNPRFVFYFFRQFPIQSYEASTSNPTLNRNNLHPVEVLWPPIPEQRRIAAILDHADVLRAKRRVALAKLGELTQSIFLEMFGDLLANRKDWPTGTLGGIATFTGGGTPSRARPEFFEGKICWATSKDMKDEFLDDTEEHITEEAISQSATKMVQPGTILVVVKSKVLAHRLPVAIARVPTCFGQDLKGIRVSESCDSTFVTWALRFGQKWLLEQARGANTEGLTLDHLRAFPLPLPPLALQREFAGRVSAITKVKAAHQASLANLNALFASLQHRAFCGEL